MSEKKIVKHYADNILVGTGKPKLGCFLLPVTTEPSHGDLVQGNEAN